MRADRHDGAAAAARGRPRRRARAATALLAAAGFGSLPAGCHTGFEMRALGCALAAEQPADGAVHPYPGATEPPMRGRLAAVFVATPTDLVDLAPRRSHHLYFVLSARRPDADDVELFTGPVYAASDGDLRAVGDAASAGERVFKVYVPLQPDRLDDPARAAAGATLCIRIGGGTMWGLASLSSNVVDAPLVIGEGELQLAPAARRF